MPNETYTGPFNFMGKKDKERVRFLLAHRTTLQGNFNADKDADCGLRVH